MVEYFIIKWSLKGVIILERFQRPLILLILMSIAMPLAFNVWNAMLNNFVVERVHFTGIEIGILQSLREVPGFLAFTTVFVLLILKEQTFAVMSLALMGLGVALTGFFPTEFGLYFTTILMSIGFHYFEAVKQSLSLQWFSIEEAPQMLGRLLAVGSITSLIVYALLWFSVNVFEIDYLFNFLTAGVLCFVLAIFMWLAFPHFGETVPQNKGLILRKRYWLYYGLTFFSGARRQIFVVFAAFMMVEKFGYTVAEVTMLFGINYAFNFLFAERIGKWISKIGERRALTLEYVGLVFVFISYGLVENTHLAAGLYVIDHMFFAMAIAMKTYFQKIADPKDMASSAGVSFTINHIAAVIIPALLGLVWVWSDSLVFYIGAGFALCSLVLAQNIPLKPGPGNEVLYEPRLKPVHGASI